jgi:hypothetical protein
MQILSRQRPVNVDPVIHRSVCAGSATQCNTGPNKATPVGLRDVACGFNAALTISNSAPIIARSAHRVRRGVMSVASDPFGIRTLLIRFYKKL